MKRILLRLYPRAWRERYGEEVLDLLASSHRPVRDSADWPPGPSPCAPAMWPPGCAATAGPPSSWVVIGLQGLLWSVPQLQEGIVEVPMHWWSSLAASPLVAGLAMLVLSFAPWGWRGSRSG